MKEHFALRAHTRAEKLAHETRSEALRRGDAVIVGSRAGVVEWASSAWRPLTGFPREETLDKPITHFLEVADLEAELVGFVAQNFIEGRRCAVEVPFSTLDGREIHVHLDVEPICEPGGYVNRFVAVAREIPKPRISTDLLLRPRHQSPSKRPPEPPAESRERVDPVSLNDIVRAGCASQRGPDMALDLVLSDQAGGVEYKATIRGTDAHQSVIRLLGLLFEAATAPAPPPHPTPRFISVVTGTIDAGRSHHSLVHAIPSRSVASRRRPGVFIEIHDTAPHLLRDALARIRKGQPTANPRERAWAEVLQSATQLGATVAFDSTPGCGNQALIVFDRTRS